MAQTVECELNTDKGFICGDNNTASGDSSSAVGYDNTARGDWSSAVGNSNTANKLYSSTFGAFNTAEVDFGTAVGFGSLANRDKGELGYSPVKNGATDKTSAEWVATSAALAVGNPDNTKLDYYDPVARAMVSIDTPITRQSLALPQVAKILMRLMWLS